MDKIPSLCVVTEPRFLHNIQTNHGKVGKSYHLSQRYIIDVRSLIGQTLSSGSQGISRTFQLQRQLQLLANQARLGPSEIANTQQQLKTMAREVNQGQLHLLESLTHLINKGLPLTQALSATKHIGRAATAYGLSVSELRPLSDAAPGMSEKDIARKVEAVLSQHEQQTQAKQRGVLFDYHEYAIS